MSNSTSKPRRAMQLVGALIAVVGLVATITAHASAQNAQSRYYSGVITGPDFCLDRSLGGPVTFPFDSDRDGVADTCSLPRSRRETAARQNAMERLGGELALYFGQLFAEECTKVAETFGEPAAEATDECAAPRAAHASGRVLSPVPQAPIPLENNSPQFFSGPVITGRISCLDRSFGGPVTYPFDSDGDGVADICALPRTRRAAVARQNAFERLAAEQEPYFNLLVAEECLRVPASFGEPAAEAADVCATGSPTPTETGEPLPTPGGTTTGGTTTGGTDPETSTPTRTPITPPTAPAATNPGTYNRKAARNVQLDPGSNQIIVSWEAVPATADEDDTANAEKTDPYDSGRVYEYEVWWAPKGQSWSTTNRWISPDVSTTRHTIVGLNNFVTYNIRIKAVRGPSGDPFTPTLTSTPGLAGPPVWPSENALTSPFYGRITADWDVPHGASDDNINSYVIQWSTSNGGFSSTRQATTAAGTTTYTIMGLSNTTYYVRVQGVTASGPGTWSLSESIRLTSTRPSPGQPTGLELTTAAGARITANWDNPSSTNEPTHYQVQWRNLSTRENWATVREHAVTTDTAGDPPSATIPPAGSSLISSNQYEVRVRAINQDIAGSWSSAARIVLGQAAPPSNVKLDPDGGHKIKVTWTDAQSVPPVSSYNLQWDTSSGFARNCPVDLSCTQVPLGTGIGSTGHEVTNLDNNVTYYFRMQSVNANGPGPWSPTLSVKPGALRAPTSASAQPIGSPSTNDDYRKLSVSWSSGNEDSKSNLTGFTIQYRITGTTSWSSRNLNDFSDRTDNTYNCTSRDIDGDVGDSPSTYSCTLTGLTSDTSYDVRIRARNSFGEGPWSLTVTGTPADGKLSAPSISVQDVTNQSGSLEVSWSEVVEAPKPAATSFQIEYCYTPDGGSEICRTTSRSLSAVNGTYQLTISGLTNDSQYDVRVRARNTHGWSDWSSVAQGTPTDS